MKAEIIASGTELLLGEVTDTNTPYIASELARLGIDLYYASTVGDNPERFKGVLRLAWERSDLVIITGGLGPTQGDITRDVVAGLLGETMSIDAGLKKELIALFSRIGIEMPDNNLRQATLIPSATPLHNDRGTAPGWWVEKDGRIIVTLPGPPRETQAMWEKQVLPRLEAQSGAVILSRTLKTWGLSEAKVDEMVAAFLSSGNPTLAMYARPDGIQLRITAKAPRESEAAAIIAGREKDLRDLLDENIWGTDAETLEEVVGKSLSEKGLTLAVAESFTGGMLAYSFSGAPESGRYFRGGIVTPADAAKAGVESAVAMAKAARTGFGADIALGIDGFLTAGDVKRDNVFITIVTESKTDTITPGYPGNLPNMVRRIITHALVHLGNYIRQSNT